MFKYKIVALFVTILFLYSFNFVSAKNNNFLLLNKVIYIDAGHGGRDPGAIYENINEKDINLDIANKLEKELQKEGAITYMTRYDDYDLSISSNKKKKNDLTKRIEIINSSNCDIYVSIHLNFEKTGLWKGPQIFYDNINEENEKIASIFQKEFNKNLYGKRKYKKIDNIYLNRKIIRPGVLIEVGFLSNDSDRYLLKQDSYKNKVANTIKNGIIKYLYK